MELTTRTRLAWLVALTVAFGASVGAMFVALGAFNPVWFFSGLGAYAVLALVTLLLGRGAPREDTHDWTPGDRPQVTSYRDEDFSLPQRPGDVEQLPAPRASPEPPEPRAVAVESQAPQAFTLRGYTLFERTARGTNGRESVQRFFSKKQPPGARPALLPEGHEAAWSRKLGKPELRPLAEPVAEVPKPPGPPVVAESPTPLAVPKPAAPEFGAPESGPRKCAAMPRPGEFCERAARGGSKYCPTHASWSPVKSQPDVVVRLDRGAAPQAGKLRFGPPALVVQQDRAAAPKPLRVKPTAVEIRVAKPSPNGRPVRPARLDVETRVAKPATTRAALKPVETEVAVRLDKPSATAQGRLDLVDVEPDVRADRVHNYARPIRPTAYDVEIIAAQRATPDVPLRVAQGEIQVNVAKPTPARGRIRDVVPEYTVRVAKPKPDARRLRPAAVRVETRVAKPKPQRKIGDLAGAYTVRVAKPRPQRKIGDIVGSYEVATSRPKAKSMKTLRRLAEQLRRAEPVTDTKARTAPRKGSAPKGQGGTSSARRR